VILVSTWLLSLALVTYSVVCENFLLECYNNTSCWDSMSAQMQTQRMHMGGAGPSFFHSNK